MSGENKRKHLEFIQNVITRMNSNSFQLKGWSIALTSALMLLFRSVEEPSVFHPLFTSILALMFWCLDAYYLYMERCFRSLYAFVSKKDCDAVDFSMDYTKYERFKDDKGKVWYEQNCWHYAVISPSIVLFYSGILVLAITMHMLTPILEKGQ